jgi:hypothetical protein
MEQTGYALIVFLKRNNFNSRKTENSHQSINPLIVIENESKEKLINW